MGGGGRKCLWEPGEQRSDDAGAGLAWFWQGGRGPASAHVDTPKVWHGCGHEPCVAQ